MTVLKISSANRGEEGIVSYKTSTYKLHYYESPTGYKFVLLSDQASESLRFVLRQIYATAFIEHVVRNPFFNELDCRKTGRGIDSDAFRGAVNQIVSNVAG